MPPKAGSDLDFSTPASRIEKSRSDPRKPKQRVPVVSRRRYAPPRLPRDPRAGPRAGRSRGGQSVVSESADPRLHVVEDVRPTPSRAPRRSLTGSSQPRRSNRDEFRQHASDPPREGARRRPHAVTFFNEPVTNAQFEPQQGRYFVFARVRGATSSRSCSLRSRTATSRSSPTGARPEQRGIVWNAAGIASCTARPAGTVRIAISTS